MTKQFLNWLKIKIAENDIHAFYQTAAWHRLSAKILAEQHECQICRSHHRYSPAEIAHHINMVREHPELALSEYADDGSRNIIAVCRKCHSEIHMGAAGYRNIERW